MNSTDIIANELYYKDKLEAFKKAQGKIQPSFDDEAVNFYIKGLERALNARQRTINTLRDENILLKMKLDRAYDTADL